MKFVKALCVQHLIKRIVMIDGLCLYTVKQILDRDKIKEISKCSGPCKKEIKGMLSISTLFHDCCMFHRCWWFADDVIKP